VAPVVRSSLRHSNGMNLERKQNWKADPDNEFKTRYRGQPYVMKSGHLSGSVYCSWKCTPYQWLATTVREVYTNILSRNAVWKRSTRKKRSQVFEIAAYYAVTMNDSNMERLINCKKVGYTPLFCYLKNKVDKNSRFLLDQILNGISWSRLRDGEPSRVRSTKMKDVRGTLNLGSMIFECRRLVARMTDDWIISCPNYTRGMAYIGT